MIDKVFVCHIALQNIIIRIITIKIWKKLLLCVPELT